MHVARKISPTIPRGRRGAVVVYAIFALLALLAVGSLAVDYGRVQLVKSELQRSADATARGNLALYAASNNNLSYAQSWGAYLPAQSINPVDAGSGVAPTVTIQWGTWNAASGAFTSGGFNASNGAVQVTASRTRANGNPVPLTWASILGFGSCNASHTSVAALAGQTSTTINVSAMSDPWLAGMPTGSSASYSDTAPSQSPTPVTSIPVIPGSYLTFTSISGLVQHGPSHTSSPPDGAAMHSHGIDSPGGPTPAAENGIADVVAPIDALLGIFLDDSRPDLTAAPSRRDYSQASERDRAAYDDIKLKQPFYIGDGQTSGGAVQQFRVPPCATRLFLGPMDGYEWGNNSGSYSVTISLIQTISIVK